MKSLRLLHAADLHLDAPFEALSPEAAARRRQGQRDLFKRLCETAEARGAEAILLCGDIFDSGRVEPETLRTVEAALSALSCPVLIAPGNHDPYFTGSVWESLKLPENVYIFKKQEIRSISFPEIPARFWGAAFGGEACPALLNSFSAPEKDGNLFDIMVIHGDIGSADSPYHPIRRPDIEKSGMDYIALGHIHTRSPLMEAGGTYFAYPGCFEGRGYDELGEKGALFVTVSKDGVSADFVPLGGLRYEILRVDVSTGEPEEVLEQALSGLPEGLCCRLILEGDCETPPDLFQIRRHFENRFHELQLRDETTKRRDIWALKGQDSLSGAFTDRLFALHEAAKTEREREKLRLAARYGLAAIENGGDLL